MNDAILARLAALEKKYVELEKKHADLVEGFEHHVNRHYDLHHDLDRMTYASYFKTHPEYAKSMDQYHDIMVAPRDSKKS